MSEEVSGDRLLMHNILGKLAVQHEVLTALLSGNPRGAELLRIAIENAQRKRDHVISRPLPDGLIGGMDMEIEGSVSV